MIFKHATRILLPPDVHRVVSALNPENNDAILVRILGDGSEVPHMEWFLATQNVSTPLSNYSIGMSFGLSIHTDNEYFDCEDEEGFDKDDEEGTKWDLKGCEIF